MSSQSLDPLSLDPMIHPETTAFSSPELVQSAQQGLDHQIRKLPPEILSLVFVFCTSSDSLSWVRVVSHICRHWRGVALSCPSLWSFPVFSHPTWAEEMLQRSKMTPLTVKADLTYMTPRMVNAVHSALMHISRISSLDLKTGSRSLSEILNLTGSAPLLHSLSLVSPGFSQEEHFTLGPTFLNGEAAPRLRKLELTRFSLPWDSPLLNNLVHLKIQNPGPAARPSMAEFTGALERMPQLETLELDYALPVIAAGVAALSMPSSRIPLSHLKRIVIANVSVLECADTLNHLTFNGKSSPTIKISCLADNSTLTDFSTLIPALSAVQSPAATTRSLRSLFVNIGFGGMTVRTWSCFPQTGYTPATRPFLDLDLKWLRFMRDESQELMAFTCKALGMQGLRGLNLSTDIQEVDTKTWVSTFGDLPALVSIRLRGQANQLVAALREDVFVDGVRKVAQAPAKKPAGHGRRASLRRPRGEELVGGLFFPALRNLILEDTDFEEPALDMLESALMERCERKQELWTLTLNDCNRLDHDGVERLENVVAEVKWDRLVMGFSEDESDADFSEYGDFYSGGGFFYHSEDDLDSEYDYSMYY
ncbi:hypothetical protein B0H14DRAFT_2689582 [Mycena olivaceomarginata]|nr:hypothetical protein B0H14DRAFT_2689582 [Mycena olivaceomarginata]